MKAPKWPRKVTVGHATVTVYRNAEPDTATGWIYVVAWNTATGRRREKFADESEALREARLKADKLADGIVEGSDVTKGDRDELQAARALVGKTPLLAALQEWVRARDVTEGNVLPACEAWANRNTTRFERITVKDVIKRFIDAKKRAGVDVTCAYDKILKALGEHVGNRLLDTLSARELQTWLDTRYPHPSTRNNARKRIVSLWRWGRKQGYLSRDAVSEAEQTEFAREAATVIGVITAETFGALLRHFAKDHPEYLAPLALAGFTGLRSTEVKGQDWRDINLERGFVRVTTAKRNTPAHRLVPLPPAAVEWLMLCKERKGPLCFNASVPRIRQIARTAKNADRKDKFPSIPRNAFRHSWISHRLAVTGDVAATSLEAGNSAAVIFRHYRELFEKSEGEAWFNLRPTGDAEVIEMSEGKSAHA